jgi:hypothetical protein
VRAEGGVGRGPDPVRGVEDGVDGVAAGSGSHLCILRRLDSNTIIVRILTIDILWN